MNQITITGNLTRDPELRTVNTTNGPVSVCTMTVAVNNRRRQNSDADFMKVTVWRNLAENCKRYLSKGRKVAVVGTASAHGWTRNDGTIAAQVEIDATEVEFLSAQGGTQSAEEAPAEPAPTYTQVEDNDLPF